MRALVLIIIATQLVGCTVYVSPSYRSRHEVTEDAHNKYLRARYKFEQLSDTMNRKPGATRNFTRLGGKRVLVDVQHEVNAGRWKHAQHRLRTAIELANRSLELTKLEVFRART